MNNPYVKQHKNSYLGSHGKKQYRMLGVVQEFHNQGMNQMNRKIVAEKLLEII